MSRSDEEVDYSVDENDHQTAVSGAKRILEALNEQVKPVFSDEKVPLCSLCCVLLPLTISIADEIH